MEDVDRSAESGPDAVWLCVPRGDRVPLLVLSDDDVVVLLRLTAAQAQRLVGAGDLDLRDLDVEAFMPSAAIDRVVTDGEQGLRIEHRHDVAPIKVRLDSVDERDQVLAVLHRRLAPQSPLVRLRRRARDFTALAGGMAAFVGLGLGVPWAVEAGHLDGTNWLVAMLYNALGPTGFRLVGLTVGGLCLIGLLGLLGTNRVRLGFEVGRG